MTIAEKFSNFCKEITISASDVEKVTYRYRRITRQLNADFWTTDSDAAHSLYVGSYGRDTDIDASDIDMLMRLPYSVYVRINGQLGNGQSSLLQEVKNSIENTYRSKKRADGQVVQVEFDDGINFEVLPAFVNDDETFTYPDTNDGGSWKITDPRSEIEAIREANADCNGNLKNLCRMMRVWKQVWDVQISGMLIDTLAYQFIKTWKYRNQSYLYYDWMTRDFFEFLKNQEEGREYWLAPGSKRYVWRKGVFEYKALRCFNISNEAIAHEVASRSYSANEKWKEIYGSRFI